MNVRERIRARVSDGTPTPAAVSRDVITELADSELRDALAVALPYLVRDEIRKLRFKAVGTPPSAWKDRSDGSSTRPSEIESWKEHAEERREVSRKGARKAAEIRETRAALFETLVTVAGEWKKLGDCTAGDLRTIAADYQGHVDRAARLATGYSTLADELDRRGLARVDEVSADEVRKRFGAVL